MEVMLDDIIVTGKSDAEYLENLEVVLRRLAKKCRSFMERIEYCGHEIDLHKTKAKIEAVQKAPRPQDGSSLRGFLDWLITTTGFYPTLPVCYIP